MKNLKIISLLIGLIITFLFTTSCGKNVNISTLYDKAEKGNPEAQLELAQYYSTGLPGLPKNHQEAFKYCQKSAEQGYAPAELQLSGMYDRAIGVGQNKEEAKKWLKKGLKDSGFIKGYGFCLSEIIEIIDFDDISKSFDTELWRIWKIISAIFWIIFWINIGKINENFKFQMALLYVQDNAEKNNNEINLTNEDADVFGKMSFIILFIFDITSFFITACIVTLPCYLWFNFFA